MPLVRINIARTASVDTVRAISTVVYDAMTRVAGVPANDKFQIVTRHAEDELIYPAQGYLGITYTPDIVFIQVTWNAGRTVEVKQAFYKAVAEGIAGKTGLRIQDVVINLVDVAREDWSFGNGEMQYAPKTA
ncbi:tautomerase family protein [Roseateles sp. L2-2]|uniref:tautomerase family protein n=1 Tax=Roseateles TaxID=93681 RepID=UPI003D361A51